MDKLEERLNHAAAFVAREGEINFPLLLSEAADALAAKQALIDELVDGLEGLFRFANGVRYTMTLGKTQLARIEAAAALIAHARSSGKACQ